MLRYTFPPLFFFSACFFSACFFSACFFSACFFSACFFSPPMNGEAFVLSTSLFPFVDRRIGVLKSGEKIFFCPNQQNQQNQLFFFFWTPFRASPLPFFIFQKKKKKSKGAFFAPSLPSFRLEKKVYEIILQAFVFFFSLCTLLCGKGQRRSLTPQHHPTRRVIVCGSVNASKLQQEGGVRERQGDTLCFHPGGLAPSPTPGASCIRNYSFYSPPLISFRATSFRLLGCSQWGKKALFFSIFIARDARLTETLWVLTQDWEPGLHPTIRS